MTEEKAPETIPPPVDPSPTVRVVKEGRELITDLGAMTLAAYLVAGHFVSAQIAMVFVLTIVLPSTVLSRYAKIILAKGGNAGTAAALIGASALYAQIKLGAVIGLGAMSVVAACIR